MISAEAVRRSALPYLGAISDEELNKLFGRIPESKGRNVVLKWQYEYGNYPIENMGKVAPSFVAPSSLEAALKETQPESWLICPTCEIAILADPDSSASFRPFSSWRSCCSTHGRLYDRAHLWVDGFTGLCRAREWCAKSPGCKHPYRVGSNWYGFVFYFALFGSRRAGRLEEVMIQEVAEENQRVSIVFPFLAITLMKQLDIYLRYPAYDWNVYCSLPLEHRFYISNICAAVLENWIPGETGESLSRNVKSDWRASMLAAMHGFFPLGPDRAHLFTIIRGTQPDEDDLRVFADLARNARSDRLLKALLAERAHTASGFAHHQVPRIFAASLGHRPSGVVSDEPSRTTDSRCYYSG